MSNRGLLLLMVLGVMANSIGSRAGRAAVMAGSFLPENKQNAPATSMSDGQMAHMYMTSLRPSKPGDVESADAVVAAAKRAMAPYQDYHKALADGFVIFLPEYSATAISLYKVRVRARGMVAF